MISVDGVTKRFGAVVAVDDLSFKIGKREVVGLLGPNGAGKTTMMRLLTSFYAPDGGAINIDGTDTTDDDVVTRSKIGYLPENNPLYEDMFVSEFLDFIGDLRGLSAAERGDAIAKVAAETGLEQVLSKPVGELSKGFRQRVGLAQAILHEPEILILDEPTEGLDPNQRVDIRGLIKQIGAKRTVLLSTHVLAEVQNTCTRVLLINRGRLVADSKVADLGDLGTSKRRVFVEATGRGIEKELEALPAVQRVEREKAGRRTRYVLSLKGREDVRLSVFNLAKEKGWELYELHEEAASLEEVFHELTLDDSALEKAEVGRK